MKKQLWITLCLFLVATILMAACNGGSENETDTTSSEVVGNVGQEMPLSTQLAIGTLLLDDSEYPVSVDQAGELLPLWKAAKSLSESSTTAQAELDALFAQIQESMTAEQLSFIETASIDPQMQADILQDAGAAIRPSGESGEGGFQGGGMGNGGGEFARPEGGGGGFAAGGGTGNLSSDQIATMQAMREEGLGGGGMRNNTFLFQVVIDKLEEKVSAAE